MKILMVCLGNICRSPLAEGILGTKLQSLNVPHLIDSAGTIGFHQGTAPDERSIQVALRNGIDISGQRAKKFVKEDFENFDYIFAMDRTNFKDLQAMAPTEQLKKLHLFLEFANLGKQDVPDPYYGEMKQFEEVFALLEGASITVANKLLLVK